PAPSSRSRRIVVARSSVLQPGESFDLDATPLTVGRGGRNDVSLNGDEFASARHVRIEPRRDGVWVHDLGSTNGTYVNGVRIEEAYVVAPPLFAVADGMGGAQAGEVASKLAAAALEETDPGALAGAARVASLIQEANRRVHERSTADPATAGMGTTMTVALVE